MQRKVMISCAVTGSADSAGKNPAVPVTPEQIAASAIDAAKAGAAIVHIHVRDPKTTLPSMDGALYAEVVDRIRQSGTDVVINLTTGPGGRFSPDADDPMKPGPGTTLRTPRQRVQHVLDLRPEICSLDMGSMNMGAERVREHAADPGSDGDRHPRRRRDAGARSVRDRAPAARQAHDRDRAHQGARHVPDLPRHRLGPAGDARGDELHAQPAAGGLAWFAFGISLHQFPMAAQAVLLGGHVRVGLEDNLYLERGKLAPSNAALVAKAGKIIELLGLQRRDAGRSARDAGAGRAAPAAIKVAV